MTVKSLAQKAHFALLFNAWLVNATAKRALKKQYRDLAALDSRMLADIGITEAQRDCAINCA